jgi:hypothetical protein
LALRPTDGETFLREVDDELRKEQLGNFVSRYGWWILAAVVVFLGGIGGWLWWQSRQEAAAGGEGEMLIEAQTAMEAGNPKGGAGKAAPLAQSPHDGYRAAALFTRANGQSLSGNIPAAIETLRGIAADQSLDPAFREAALVRQTALEFDTIRPQAVVQRLRPLARPGSAWLGSAGEMVGIAYLKMGRRDLAGPIFGQIARDESVPESIRLRAVQMASALGVDPAAGRGARTATPATREKAE